MVANPCTPVRAAWRRTRVSQPTGNELRRLPCGWPTSGSFDCDRSVIDFPGAITSSDVTARSLVPSA
jgi:hypothetical protein